MSDAGPPAAKRAYSKVVWHLPYGQRIGPDSKPEPKPDAVAVIRNGNELIPPRVGLMTSDTQ